MFKGSTLHASRFTLRAVVNHLKNGGIVIYPTETAYAIGCDATNRKAVQMIFNIKGREQGKPLPLIVADLTMGAKYGILNFQAKTLAAKYWPGALTLIVGIRGKVLGTSKGGKILTPNTYNLAPSVPLGGTVAVRVSSHPVARALSKGLGRPIVSTSANTSGTPPCYSVEEAVRSLQLRATPHLNPLPARGARKGIQSSSLAHKVGEGRVRVMILDGGKLPKRKPSTIIDVTGKEIKIVREGSIKIVERKA